MTADQDRQTEDQPQAAAPAEKPVAEGYKRIKMEAHYFDVKIEPDPLADQVFGYVGTEASRFDQYANQLYARGVALVEELKRAEPGEIEPSIEFARQQEIDAIYCALSNLRQAANQLRAAKLALSPYVKPELLSRSY